MDDKQLWFCPHTGYTISNAQTQQYLNSDDPVYIERAESYLPFSTIEILNIYMDILRQYKEEFGHTIRTKFITESYTAASKGEIHQAFLESGLSCLFPLRH